MSKKTIALLCAGAVLCILFGLSLILWPAQARQVICYVLGGLFTLFGICSILAYFVRKTLLTSTQFGLAVGAVAMLLGLFLLFRNDFVVAALVVIIGITVIITSVSRLQLALNLKRALGTQMLPMLISSLVTLGFGALLLFNPFKAANAANILAGIALLLDGVLNLWSAIQYAVLQKRAAKPETPRVN